MTDPHPELGVELRLLAQAILDRLDPAIRAAAARTAAAEPGKCQQLWCPVCALAALVNGEAHPLLSMIGEHSLTLLAVVRAVADVPAAPAAAPEPPIPGSPQGPPSDPDRPRPNPDRPRPDPGSPGNYQHIPIIIDE